MKCLPNEQDWSRISSLFGSGSVGLGIPKMNRLKFIIIFQCIIFMSCSNSTAQIAKYRYISEITAYKKDGSTEYYERVLQTDIAKVENEYILLPLLKGKDKFYKLKFRKNGEIITYYAENIETIGSLNSWTRIKPYQGIIEDSINVEICLGNNCPEK